MSSAPAFHFGRFRYSAASGLRAGDRAVALGACPQRCLEVLLEARGAVVPKQRLINAVWGGVASDSSLARSVYLLRLALGDDDGDVVGTVYGRGYRIAVPVHVTTVATVPTASSYALGTAAAHELLLTAFEFLGARRAASLRLALEAVARATQTDPSYVAAWAMLAQVWLVLAIRGVVPWEAAQAGIEDASARALALDPAHAHALALRGVHAAIARRDFEAAWADLDRAVSIDPGYSRTFRLRGYVALLGGDPRRAVAEYDAAIARAPLDADSVAARDWALFLAGEVDAAVRSVRAAAARWPAVDTVQALLCVLASWLDSHDEAIAAGRRAVELNDGQPNFATSLAYALARAGRAGDARALLAGLEQGGAPASPALRVAPWTALGDRARAAALEVEARRADPLWRHELDLDPRLEGRVAGRRLAG
jgi:DNA-binding winged helix-turn-helix (wHTH) protein